jgi:hypothetical protein
LTPEAEAEQRVHQLQWTRSLFEYGIAIFLV